MNISFFKPKKLLLFCAVFLIGLISSIPVFALDFNGVSGSSGGGGTASSGYAVNTDGTALIGFRFSLVDSSNIQQGNSIDIVSNGNYNAYLDYKKFIYKQSKAYWVSNYSEEDIDTVYEDGSVNNTNFYNGKTLGFKSSLPEISSSTDIDNLSANLTVWQQYEDNINAVLSLIGSDEVSKVSELGDYKIIIEPLFSVGLLNGDDHILTMTELAVYGGGKPPLNEGVLFF